MKKFYLKAALCLAVGLAFILGVSQTMAAERIYLMTGKISAIDQQFNTVVVEVPLGEQLFTVGGPLSPGAVLKKGGQAAGLEDFSVGEQVKVRWRATEKGHIIEMIESLSKGR